jgi:hypothetical protein
MSADIELELVRELHPRSDGSREARDRARAALLAAVSQANNPGTHRLRARPRLPVLPSIGLLSAAAAVAAVIAVVVGLNGAAGQPASAAAAMLQRAARAAAAAGGPRQLRPGEYWYVHSREITNGAVFPDQNARPGHDLVIVDALTTYDRQDWIGIDTRGAYTTRIIGTKFLSAAARHQWERDGRPAPLSGQGRFPVPADGFDRPYKQLLALPTNVGGLYNVVNGDTTQGSPAWRRHEMSRSSVISCA